MDFYKVFWLNDASWPRKKPRKPLFFHRRNCLSSENVNCFDTFIPVMCEKLYTFPVNVVIQWWCQIMPHYCFVFNTLVLDECYELKFEESSDDWRTYLCNPSTPRWLHKMCIIFLRGFQASPTSRYIWTLLLWRRTMMEEFLGCQRG